MTIHLSSIQPHPSLRASYLTVSWDAENVGASHFGIDTSSYQILRNRSLWASISGNCQFQANERSTFVLEELCNDTRQYNSLELKYWIQVNSTQIPNSYELNLFYEHHKVFKAAIKVYRLQCHQCLVTSAEKQIHLQFHTLPLILISSPSSSSLRQVCAGKGNTRFVILQSVANVPQFTQSYYQIEDLILQYDLILQQICFSIKVFQYIHLLSTWFWKLSSNLAQDLIKLSYEIL